MTTRTHMRRTVLAGGLVAAFIGSTAMGDVFYRNEISGGLLSGDEILESFTTLANWDAPKYDWDFFSGQSAAIDIRQVSVRFNFALSDGIEVNFSDDEFYGWVFTDMNNTASDHRLEDRRTTSYFSCSTNSRSVPSPTPGSARAVLAWRFRRIRRAAVWTVE